MISESIYMLVQGLAALSLTRRGQNWECSLYIGHGWASQVLAKAGAKSIYGQNDVERLPMVAMVTVMKCDEVRTPWTIHHSLPYREVTGSY